MTHTDHARLRALRHLMQERETEALLITSLHNRRYLSGFSGSAGALLVSAAVALIFTDFRYRTRAHQEAPAFELHEISSEHPLGAALAAAAQQHSIARIAFEPDHLTVAQHQNLAAALAASEELEPASSDMVALLREVKEPTEIATLRRAIAITDKALATVVPLLRPEHTERQAAWMLEVAMRERGADGVAFPIIVAAGANAAQPHAEPGEELLGTGRPIVIDMGALYQGYHADLTRTITLGEPEPRFWEIYHTVLAAQQRATAAIRPGMRGGEADALARDYITDTGYGDNFGHSLGHGVGLDIHEGPRLRRTETEHLRAGNVFSIEPGIYLEGWGGVRIEDLALLTEQGCEVLSGAEKQPMIHRS